MRMCVCVVQAGNISSELKVAVARSQSVWACAEQHCSAAPRGEREAEREEF